MCHQIIIKLFIEVVKLHCFKLKEIATSYDCREPLKSGEKFVDRCLLSIFDIIQDIFVNADANLVKFFDKGVPVCIARIRTHSLLQTLDLVGFDVQNLVLFSFLKANLIHHSCTQKLTIIRFRASR